MKNKTKKNTLIILSIILLSLVVLISIFKEDLINKKLESVLSKEFKGYYQLKYKTLKTSFSFIHFSLIIEKPNFKTDTTQNLKRKLPIIFFEGEKLEVIDLNIISLLRGKKLKLSKILLENPNLKMFIRSKAEKKQTNKKQVDKNGKKGLDGFQIGEIIINEAVIKQINIKDRKEIYSSTKLYLNIKDAKVDVNMLNTPIKAMTFENLIVNSGHNSFEPIGGNFKYGIDSLYINYDTEEFLAENIAFKAKKNIETISKEKDDQKIVPVFNIGKIYSNTMNYKNYFYNDTIKIDSLNISKAKVLLYQNKTTNKDFSVKKSALSKTINNIKLPISINKLTIDDTDLKFDLKTTEEQKVTSINFSNLKIIISKFSTFVKDTLKVEAFTKFQNEGNLHLKLKIPFQDTINFKQYFEGSLTNIKMQSLSNIVEGFAPIKIIDGKIHQLYFKGIANENNSNGIAILKYNDLKVEVLNNHHKKSNFLSVVGNTVVHSNNPNMKGELHTADFYFEKKQWQDQTALIINGILDGVIKSILITPLQPKKNKK
jgi:hypothetical protein